MITESGLIALLPDWNKKMIANLDVQRWEIRKEGFSRDSISFA
jgi:hypothetical protein